MTNYSGAEITEFTLIHNVCGKPAVYSYTLDTDYSWDGENETPYDTTSLVFQCDHCKVFVYIDSKSI